MKMYSLYSTIHPENREYIFIYIISVLNGKTAFEFLKNDDGSFPLNIVLTFTLPYQNE